MCGGHSHYIRIHRFFVILLLCWRAIDISIIRDLFTNRFSAGIFHQVPCIQMGLASWSFFSCTFLSALFSVIIQSKTYITSSSKCSSKGYLFFITDLQILSFLFLYPFCFSSLPRLSNMIGLPSSTIFQAKFAVIILSFVVLISDFLII